MNTKKTIKTYWKKFIKMTKTCIKITKTLKLKWKTKKYKNKKYIKY